MTSTRVSAPCFLCAGKGVRGAVLLQTEGRMGFLLLVSVRTGDVALGHPKAGGRERLGEAAWPGVAMRQLYYFVYNLTAPYA